MSSILDALQSPGGGPPGGPPGGGPSPLAGPMGGPPGGGPPSGGQPGQPDNPDAESALQNALDAIHAFIAAEEDDQDKTVAAKCLAQLQGIMGARQKQDEAAQGITPAHKAMGRAMKRPSGGGGGAPPGGPGGY